MGRQLTFRYGNGLQCALAVLDAAAEEQGHACVETYLEALMPKFIAKVLCGELCPDDFQPEVGPLRHRLGLSFSEPTLRAFEALAQTQGLTLSALVRGLILLEPRFRERAVLETEYRTSGEPGDPQSMSDAFLYLWKRHRIERHDHGTDSQVLAALRTLEVRCAQLEQELRRLQALAPFIDIGVRIDRKPPTRTELDAMSLTDIRTVADTWGFTIPKKAQKAGALRLACRHFGYPLIQED